MERRILQEPVIQEPVIQEPGAGDYKAGDAQSINRRRLLLGGGAAALSVACGGADDFQYEAEAVGTLAQAQTSTPDFSAVPEWSWSHIYNGFVWIRDARYLTWPDFPAFKRRITWLYPESGCEARAELVGHWIANRYGEQEPYKIFVVGDVTLETENHPDGSVSWGWHVVPVIKSSATHREYILDPAVRPDRPVRWSEYTNALTFNSGSQITVVTPDNYSPFSFWNSNGGVSKATSAVKDLLNAEWTRQVQLGNNPFQTLGDNPPWL